MKIKDPFVYALIRVDIKTFTNLPNELRDNHIKDVQVFIPTLDILQKTYKGVNHYKVIPLLFNYGFLRLKKSRLYNRDFVNHLPKVIPSIHTWVKSLETIHPKKVKLRVDTLDYFDDFSAVATVKASEVKALMELSNKNRIYSLDDITDLPIGSVVTLRGYPYNGLLATILSINPQKQTVKVKMSDELMSLTLDIDYQNIFYTPYHDGSEDILLANQLYEYQEYHSFDETDETVDY